MTMLAVDRPSYRGYRFLAAIISHYVWLSYTFALSYRDVEEMMAERGIKVTYETSREWSPEVWWDVCQAHAFRPASPGRQMASR